MNGRPVRESTETDKETEAKRILDGRRGRVATGQAVLPRVDLVEYTYRVAHLTAFFDGRRISGIGQPDVDAYTLKRQADGAVGSTIRRKLGTLRRMLRLAYENGKLMRLPILHLPKEGAAREGFFERDQYDAVRRHLALDHQVAAAVAYT